MLSLLSQVLASTKVLGYLLHVINLLINIYSTPLAPPTRPAHSTIHRQALTPPPCRLRGVAGPVSRHRIGVITRS